MKPIGSSQKAILEFVRGYTSAHNYPPTVREIAGSLDLAVSTVHEHLSHLRSKGLLRHEPGRSRSLCFSGKPEVVELPFIGEIAAGRPVLAVEELKDWIPLPKDFIRGGDFVIRVKGNSMMGEGIHDGDHVVIHKQPAAQDGEIVAALIEEEVTLKKFYKKKDHILLKAANPHYEDLKFKQVKILGKVVGLLRRYS